MNSIDEYYLMEILRKGEIDNAEDFMFFSKIAEYFPAEDTGVVRHGTYRVRLDFLGYESCCCEIEVSTLEKQGEPMYILSDCIDIRFFNDEYVEFGSLEGLEWHMKYDAFGVKIYKNEVFTPEEFYDALGENYHDHVPYEDCLKNIMDGGLCLYDENEVLRVINLEYKDGYVKVLGFS